MRVAVLGATGHTGRLLVRELRARGADVIACGRRADALAPLAGPGVETRVADAAGAASLADALRDADAVANLAGPFLATGDAPVRAAIARGIPYADTTGEQAFMAQVRRLHHGAARAAGVAVVNALAFEYAFADLAVRAHLPEGGDALHVLYRPRGTRASAGTKKSVLRVMGAPALGHEQGRTRPTRPARHARTFATADGARDAVSFPGGEILTVPTHTPFRTVRTYVPARSPRLARALAPAARLLLRGPALRLAERVVDARHAPPERAHGELYLDAPGLGALLVRTPDPYVATAHVMAEGILRLPDAPEHGVLAPARALDPAGTLAALVRAMPEFTIAPAP